tara:strand:- start:49 stop:222 length:174 start_codon:yes stop_codon:yes gene_type:complete
MEVRVKVLMDKKGYKKWTEHVDKHNYENPNDTISYEVSWQDDSYEVKILNLKVDNEG